MHSFSQAGRAGFVSVGRVIVSVVIPIVGFLGLWWGYDFLKEGRAPGWLISLVAIAWGVGGVAFLYGGLHGIVKRLPAKLSGALMPFVFVGPALAILGWYLLLPTVRTFWLSFFDASSAHFVGLDNYFFVFTDSLMLESFFNNIWWMVFGTGLSVLMGLVIALAADRSRYEKFYKTLIFLPMAISFIGAGVIWKFVYAYIPAGEDQIGLLNALVVFLGGEPQAWLVGRPLNTFFLILILVWLQTGYAMVLLSSAIKGVPQEQLEAARVDGASEMEVISKVVIPAIRGTIVTVATTVLIVTLKIFDIVFTMTNGLNGTEVVASQQYKQMFRFLHYGRGSAIAVVLLLAVVPVMIYNLRQFAMRRAER